MPASITLTVAHLPSATSFFLACLQPLSYVYRGRVDNTIGFGLPDGPPDFWITQTIPGVPPGPAHVAFPAASRDVVRQFFLAAIKTGAKCQGEPALRDSQTGYYSAAVIDFDNNSIEAVYRDDILRMSNDASSNTKSVVSTRQSSVAKSKSPTIVSSVSNAKTVTPTQARSVAKSETSRALTRAPSSMSSVAPSGTARTAISKAHSQPSHHYDAQGNGVSGFLNEAKGTLNVAKELVSSVSGSKSKPPADSDSHGPSDAIVGTLLAVAAGAALHYALSNRKKDDESKSSEDVHYPGIARSETAPSYLQERYRYYHNYQPPPPQLAIDSGRSTYSRSSGQRMIEMIDNDPARSDHTTSTVRQQRRNSFSGSIASASPTARGKKSTTTSVAPPNSYRAPTHTSRKTSRSRSSSISRESSGTIRPSAPSPKQDEGYVSASDTQSRTSRRSSVKHSKAPASETSSSAKPSHRRNSTTARDHHASSIVTAIRNHTEPIPSHRNRHQHQHQTSSSSELDRQSFHSAKETHPSAVIVGKLTRKQLEKLEDNGRPRSDITRSVIGKVKDVDRLGLSSREVRPEDSVSQASSNTSSARRKR